MAGLKILGAGPHGKVVASTALAAGRPVAAFYDDDAAKRGTTVLGVPVAGPIAEAGGGEAVLGLGSNRLRWALSERFPHHWTALSHPSAVVHPTVARGPGSVVFAGAVLQPDAAVGPHAIVNTSASVDHDGRVGAFAHVGPGARLAGNVIVGEGAFLGVGAVVAPNVRIGAWSVVGAGSVVLRDVPPEVTVVGAPAAPVRKVVP